MFKNYIKKVHVPITLFGGVLGTGYGMYNGLNDKRNPNDAIFKMTSITTHATFGFMAGTLVFGLYPISIPTYMLYKYNDKKY